MRNKLSILSVIGLAWFVSACTTEPKLPVPDNNPPVIAVQENVEAYKDKYVTWGGIILETHTRQDLTEIVILSKRLTQSTRPVEQDESLGRFVAQSKLFLDPALYAPNREITVHGKVVRKEQRKIGDYDYSYPIVAVESLYLWPPRPEPDPYWYDPWYGPWYHPYPYYPYYPYYHPRTIDSVTVPK